MFIIPTETKVNLKINILQTDEQFSTIPNPSENELYFAPDNPSASIDVILTASGWIGSDAPYTQILTVNGITTTNNAHWDAAMNATREQLDNAGACFIKATAQAVNQITFTAYDDKPSVDIPISVVILS